jgi:hypothetical protein
MSGNGIAKFRAILWGNQDLRGPTHDMRSVVSAVIGLGLIGPTLPCLAQSDVQRRAMEADLRQQNPGCNVQISAVQAGRLWGLSERAFVVRYGLDYCGENREGVAVFAETQARPRPVPIETATGQTQASFPKIDSASVEDGRLLIVASSTGDVAKPWKRQFRFGLKQGRLAELGSRGLE